MPQQGNPTKITLVYSNPANPANPADPEAFEAFEAFEAAYPDQLAPARKLPGLTRLQASKVWPKGTTLEHATGGVLIAFAEILEDA